MLIHLLRQYLKTYKWQLLLVVILQCASAVANLYMPTLNADIIDNGVAQGDTGYIWREGGLMLAVAAVSVACAIVSVIFGARISSAFGRDLRDAEFTRVNTFSHREVSKFGAPSLITRATNDVQQVQMLVLMLLLILITAPIFMVGGTIMALHHDVPLSSLLLVIIPVMAIFAVIVVRMMAPTFKLVQKALDRINDVLREQITGVRVIRAFVHDDFERDRFDGANRHITKLQLRVGRIFSFMFPFIMLIMNLSSIAVMWFGGHRIESGHMEVGDLTAFLTYLMQILMAVLMAAMMAFMIPRAQVCAGRISEVLETNTSIVEAAEPVRTFPAPGEIAMKGAAFRYSGAAEPVIKDIAFEAHPGQTLAIIGATGSGKTTLVNLIPRLFDATEGQVMVGGVDVKEAGLQELWNQIGLVPQKPFLFSGTIRSNLQYGKEDATDEDCWEALRVAQADDFVSETPGGLDAEVAAGGTNVSGGQRQRLAIARALIRKPKVYIFDDSFSALDFATDARLRQALAPVTRDATVVIVAQRVGTIRDADQILVLEAGRIVGQGRHEELMETCETYQEIVYSQLSAEEAMA
ncbi:MAG: ABC transporter ATP-binding protein/permease [Bifidobacteriaceae bacterium]|jgi:ATP-binding cassette subfamily B protein|nr:ABC transporter ATP-binding protein/permease [Bifidobacteriaceae bacterium]